MNFETKIFKSAPKDTEKLCQMVGNMLQRTENSWINLHCIKISNTLHWIEIQLNTNRSSLCDLKNWEFPFLTNRLATTDIKNLGF